VVKVPIYWKWLRAQRPRTSVLDGDWLHSTNTDWSARLTEEKFGQIELLRIPSMTLHHIGSLKQQ